MLGGADNPNGELPSYITGADILHQLGFKITITITWSCQLKAASRGFNGLFSGTIFTIDFNILSQMGVEFSYQSGFC